MFGHVWTFPLKCFASSHFARSFSIFLFLEAKHPNLSSSILAVQVRTTNSSPYTPWWRQSNSMKLSSDRQKAPERRRDVWQYRRVSPIVSLCFIAETKKHQSSTYWVHLSHYFSTLRIFDNIEYQYWVLLHLAKIFPVSEAVSGLWNSLDVDLGAGGALHEHRRGVGDHRRRGLRHRHRRAQGAKLRCRRRPTAVEVLKFSVSHGNW